VCGGAIGNAIDRMRSGEVVDFLHVHAGEAFHWATFNVADVYITVGVVLLLWDALRRPRSASVPKAETAT
jgi:signal peptidase II